LNLPLQANFTDKRIYLIDISLKRLPYWKRYRCLYLSITSPLHDRTCFMVICVS